MTSRGVCRVPRETGQCTSRCHTWALLTTRARSGAHVASRRCVSRQSGRCHPAQATRITRPITRADAACNRHYYAHLTAIRRRARPAITTRTPDSNPQGAHYPPWRADEPSAPTTRADAACNRHSYAHLTATRRAGTARRHERMNPPRQSRVPTLPATVIPAQAGTQRLAGWPEALGSGLRRNDELRRLPRAMRNRTMHKSVSHSARRAMRARGSAPGRTDSHHATPATLPREHDADHPTKSPSHPATQRSLS